MVCQHCGAALAATVTASGTGAVCLECGVAQPPVSQFTTSQPLDWGYDSQTQAQLEQKTERSEPPLGTHALSFTGTAGEFFRIWIVNVFLTVVTLGIYNAWAKVRTRQYFYAHTHLAGHSFDYLANPINILKGNLIVAAGLGIYYFTGTFAPEWNLAVILAFFLVFPFLVYQSLNFRARYSAYRNIRFHFHGTLVESYNIFIWLPLLVPLTLGLILPYLFYRKKKYAFDHFAFGTAKADFHGTSGKFYKVYILAYIVMAGLLALVGLGLESVTSLVEQSSDAFRWIMETGVLAVFLLAYVIVTTTVQEYIFASITNYTWQHTNLGKVEFRSTLEFGKLAWIRLTNLFAMLLSFGLLIPWAKVRRTRYIVENLAVAMREGELDDFVADESSYQSSLGDVATDALDIEIGL